MTRDYRARRRRAHMQPDPDNGPWLFVATAVAFCTTVVLFVCLSAHLG
jgi:hypothetical protein